jgi:ribosomal-protein-alanine N-acetyltransferase
MKIIGSATRVFISEYQADDLPLCLAQASDAEVTHYTPKRTNDQNIEVFEQNLINYANGTRLGRWAICDAITGEYAGNCLLFPARPSLTRIEVGYALHKKYWGRNVGTEIATLLVAYGFSKLSLERICAITHPDNIASQRVLKKFILLVLAPCSCLMNICLILIQRPAFRPKL